MTETDVAPRKPHAQIVGAGSVAAIAPNTVVATVMPNTARAELT